jgi:hypothetical protein
MAQRDSFHPDMSECAAFYDGWRANQSPGDQTSQLLRCNAIAGGMMIVDQSRRRGVFATPGCSIPTGGRSGNCATNSSLPPMPST